MANNSGYRDQLESLYGISAQIASLRFKPQWLRPLLRVN